MLSHPALRLHRGRRAHPRQLVHGIVLRGLRPLRLRAGARLRQGARARRRAHHRAPERAQPPVLDVRPGGGRPGAGAPHGRGQRRAAAAGLVQTRSRSKTFCTRTAFDVASDAIQLFGGNGLTREYPIEEVLGDARASMIEDGCNEVLGLVGAAKLVEGRRQEFARTATGRRSGTGRDRRQKESHGTAASARPGVARSASSIPTAPSRWRRSSACWRQRASRSHWGQRAEPARRGGDARHRGARGDRRHRGSERRVAAARGAGDHRVVPRHRGRRRAERPPAGALDCGALGFGPTRSRAREGASSRSSSRSCRC